MKYALIENNIVTNILELNPRNAADFPAAVSVEEYPVCVGDNYKNNAFYRNGEEVLSYARIEEIAAASDAPDVEFEPIDDGSLTEVNTYKEALNLLGVETEEVTDDAE